MYVLKVLNIFHDLLVWVSSESQLYLWFILVQCRQYFTWTSTEANLFSLLFFYFYKLCLIVYIGLRITVSMYNSVHMLFFWSCWIVCRCLVAGTLKCGCMYNGKSKFFCLFFTFVPYISILSKFTVHQYMHKWLS